MPHSTFRSSRRLRPGWSARRGGTGSNGWIRAHSSSETIHGSAVSGGTAAPGQAVILAAAAPSTTEDWEVGFDGTVNDFFNAGLINATLDEQYGPDAAYEFQYKPGGISSGLCLGIASGPAQGTKVTLQPCGVTVNTIWINDAADGSDGYAPYVSGSDTQYPAPFVLTASKVGGHFTTRALKTNKKGVIAKAQMWQLISGVLP